MFLGFLIMENKIKECTERVIKSLTGIKSIMATGDNMLTAI